MQPGFAFFFLACIEAGTIRQTRSQIFSHLVHGPLFLSQLAELKQEHSLLTDIQTIEFSHLAHSEQI